MLLACSTRLHSWRKTAQKLRCGSSLAVVLGIVLIGLSACSPVYVMQAAYEQSKILLARRNIADVLVDSETSKEDKAKLSLVLDARKFAEKIGLDPGGAFTQYADIGKDTLAWVVVASRKDSFSLYTWWFPIVGRVPYKGYFSEDGAKNQARALERMGYESSVRGTEAFSTLGWFDDPVLSTTLKNSPIRIVNTVLHESVHSTVWIKNNVPFNESLANFVGNQATIDFFSARLNDDSVSSNHASYNISEQRKSEYSRATMDKSELAYLAQAQREHAFQREFSEVVMKLHRELSILYGRADLSSDEKITRRQGIFIDNIAPFRARYPSMTALKSLNNAEVAQFLIYLTEFKMFERLFERSKYSWPVFWGRIRDIQKSLNDVQSRDPFIVLAKYLNS